ncbi:MAG: cytochrome b [Caldimonas sp.]
MSSSFVTSGSWGKPMPWRYGATAIALHWLVALLLIGQTSLGWYMMAVEHEPGADQYVVLHKSFGLMIATLFVVRLLWRLTHPRQPLPATVPRWESRLADVAQVLLYALMVVIPIVGYIGASYSKSGVPFFGVPTPRWRTPDHDTAELFFGIHGALAWALVAVVALHAAGALKHLLVDRDGVFRRMWPAALARRETP